MALAEAYVSLGNYIEAIEQLHIGLKHRDSDFYHSSIAEARLHQLRELEKETRRQAQP
jgi:predicted Zn-dependent protease